MYMKRMCKKLLMALLAVMLMMTAAAAENLKLSATPTPGPTPVPAQRVAGASILPVDQIGFMGMQNVVPVGEEVYMLTTDGTLAELWHWGVGMEQAELLDNGLLYAVNLNSLEDAERTAASTEEAFGTDVYHAIGAIFTDGTRLYGYNNLTRQVFLIDVTENGLAYTDVAVLPEITGKRVYLPISLHVAGEWLLWHETDENSRSYDERLLAYHLKTGAVKQAVLPKLNGVSSYKDGKVLVLCDANEKQADGSSAVYAYDPATDLADFLGMLPRGLYVRTFTYSASLDMLVYQDKTRIMGWTAENGAEQLAFIPTMMGASITAVRDMLLYNAEAPGIQTLELQRGYTTGHRLMLLGGSMHEVLSQFYMRYQDVPVYRTDLLGGESNVEAFNRTEDMPDMAYIPATGAGYQELLDGGYLLDLSGYPELMAYADKLYPVWRELVEKDGGVYALPVKASSYNGWFINKQVMQDMGLNEADIPTSLTGLCEFATKWNDEYAEKYPHYTLLNNTTGYRKRLLEAILSSWLDYCQANDKPLTMDDPQLWEALAALDEAQLDKLDDGLKQTNPEVSEYKQALIWTGCKVVGNWASYMEEYSDRIFIPLTLTDETPYVAAVTSCSLWVINAKSENAEYAASLLADYLGKQNVKDAYVMRTDLTEPVVNDSYSEQVAYEQERLAMLEESYEDSVNRPAAERRIEQQKRYIENELIRNMYDITPSAIENYRSVIALAAFIRTQDVLTGGHTWTGEAADLINRYEMGEIDMESFASGMDVLLK